MKSVLLLPVPFGLVTLRRPDWALPGTVVAMLVVNAVVTTAKAELNNTLLLGDTASKFAPEIVTRVPAPPKVGVNPVMVGTSEPVTVKDAAVVALPLGDVTLILPVVAPDGTAVVSVFAVAVVTVAATPLNLTVFWLGMAPNPVPLMVTAVPTGPPFGVKSMMVIWLGVWRVMESRLPAAS